MKLAIKIIKEEIAWREERFNMLKEPVTEDYLKSLKKALSCIEQEYLSRCPDCDVRYVYTNINSYYCPKCYKQFSNI